MAKSKIFWFDNAVAGLAVIIKGWQRHRDRSPEQMGDAMRFSANTWFNRMRTPEKLTVAEVWRAINYLKIPTDEAVAMLTAGIESLQTSKNWKRIMEELR